MSKLTKEELCTAFDYVWCEHTGGNSVLRYAACGDIVEDEDAQGMFNDLKKSIGEYAGTIK